MIGRCIAMLGVWVLLGCAVPDLLTDRLCPCAAGWHCDEATNRCVQGEGVDAGPVDSGADAHVGDARTEDAGADAAVGDGGPTRPTVYARPAAAAVMSDGLLAETTWSEATWIEFENPRSDNTVRVAVAWSPTALHIGYDVTDPSVEGGLTEVWANDGVELQLDPLYTRTMRPDADDLQTIVTATGIATADPAAVVGAARTVAGYSIEIAIPWTRLALSPRAGTTMGVLFANNDRDGGVRELIDWLRLADIDAETTYFQPNLWGDLVLID